jgi:hypothetical protein
MLSIRKMNKGCCIALESKYSKSRSFVMNDFYGKSAKQLHLAVFILFK